MTDAAPALLRADSWTNLLTGLGDAARDKRLAARAVTNLLTYDDAHTLYRGNALAKRIVNRPAREMVRAGFDVCVDDDSDAGEEVGAALEALRVKAVLNEALRLRRAYGGALVVVGANDGAGLTSLREPLAENRIASIDFLTVLDPRDAFATEYQANPFAPGFGEPTLYRVQPRALGTVGIGVVDVHASRVLRFCEPVASLDDLQSNHGWGDPILGAAHGVLRDFDMTWDGAAALITDFAQAVWKVEGLAEAIAAGRTELVIDRLKIMDLSRSMLRGTVIDSKEDFERKPTPVSGLPDLMDRFASRLSAAVDMPISLLMGESPSGLNATGSSEIRSWYDYLSSLQETDLQPQVERLVRLLMLSKAGPTKGVEPEVWSVKFRPFWQLDDVQQADVRSKLATADAVYLTNGVVTPDEVATSRFGGDTFGNDLQLDRSNRSAFADVDPNDPTLAEGLREPQGDEEGEGAATPRLSPLAAPAGAQGAEAGADKAKSGAAVIDLVAQVADEAIPRESGVAILVHVYGFAKQQAEEILADAGNGFEPKEDPAPVIAPPGAPGAKPPAVKPAKPAKVPAK